MARTEPRKSRLRRERGSTSEVNQRFDFGLPEYLWDVSVKVSELRPHHLQYRGSFTNFEDDQQITAAALWLHPLLGSSAVNAVNTLLPFEASVREHPSGAVLAELGASQDEAIHLLIAGRARLVATPVTPEPSTEKAWVVAQYGPGQWIGLSQLLRNFDSEYHHESRAKEWPVERVRLTVEFLSDAKTQRMALGDALTLMHQHADFRTFVEHHVAVRFARRRELLERVAEDPLLALLKPSDREYLLQLGAIVESEPYSEEPYLPAGKARGRAALILRGEAKLLVPLSGGTPDRAASLGYGASIGPGNLIGHEELVMASERANTPPAKVEIIEPKRVSSVRLAPQTQVLQFFWYALRWVLDSRAPVWQRVQALLRGEPEDLVVRMPTIVIFHAAKTGLGTSTLAYGTAAALAAQEGCTVKLIDLQGASNFESKWGQQRFLQSPQRARLHSDIRELRAPGRPEDFNWGGYVALQPPDTADWPERLEVTWPDYEDDVDAAEMLIDLMEAQEGVNYIIVAGHDATMTRLGARLDGRCHTVFYVCDNADQAYPAPEPERLTWVYRMTPNYVAAERDRATRIRDAWATQAEETRSIPFLGLLSKTNTADPKVLEQEALLGPRRVVRVPDDVPGAEASSRGHLTTLVADPDRALGRACQRLARVVQGRAVGLALGGGGAWGFAHVALIKNLEQQGVPIDFIAGTSFGAVVGGLYAVGGMPALDFLVSNNEPEGPGIVQTLRAVLSGRLNRAMLVAPFDTIAVERFMDGQLRAADPKLDDDPPCLGTTEIPFYPVGTNLNTHEVLTLPHATLGFGVRMSGSLPPVYSTLLRRGHRVADGAFIANVPSRLVRDVGADFVVASNVVPPPPTRTLAGEGIGRWLSRVTIGRFEDAVRGVFVLAWKAGVDQGELAANCTMDLRPTAANLIETWRGRDVVEEVLTRLSLPKNRDFISSAWASFYEARVAGVTNTIHAFSDTKPQAKIA